MCGVPVPFSARSREEYESEEARVMGVSMLQFAPSYDAYLTAYSHVLEE